MSKNGRYFDAKLAFGCESELRDQLMALGYMRGDAGEVAPICRNLLREAVNERIAQMDPQERRDFNKIMESVRTKALVSRFEHEERQREKMRNERLMSSDPDSPPT